MEDTGGAVRVLDWITSLLSKVADQFRLQGALTVIHTRGKPNVHPALVFGCTFFCGFFVVVACLAAGLCDSSWPKLGGVDFCDPLSVSVSRT